ncbi:MAG: SH3 domain-containing protein [Oscillospiraceae bacterium]|nr:SH3 domain-containing protein [Oscillospiraceae bacterium]
MARTSKPDELIHCEVCGEDYSPTYRRCPFCGEKPGARPVERSDEDDGYRFDGQAYFDAPDEDNSHPSNRGGKRLASGGRGSRSAPPPPISPMRLITFILSLAIIIAALVIIFTVVYPKLHTNPNPKPSPSPSQSMPVDPTDQPTEEPTDQPTEEPTASPEPEEPPLTRLEVNKTDFTLKANESYTPTVTMEPADWSGTLTWSIDHEDYATVDQNGKITNVNATASLHRAIVTVSGGGKSVTITVYCRSGSTSPDAPSVSTPDPDGNYNDLLPGTEGKITGASSGLRVRSGPGTTYDVLASLQNGNAVTVLENAGSGWYRISYQGSGGVKTGYIMGEYIKAN